MEAHRHSLTRLRVVEHTLATPVAVLLQEEPFRAKLEELGLPRPVGTRRSLFVVHGPDFSFLPLDQVDLPNET
jgi:hypothetical protein